MKKIQFNRYQKNWVKNSNMMYLSNWPPEGRIIQRNLNYTIFFRGQNKLYHDISNCFTWKSTHHGLGPGADVPTKWLFRNIDLQVAIGWVEPPGPFSLLFLHHKLERASQSQLIVLSWYSWHCCRNLHVILRTGFFMDNGVPVRVTCSVSLESRREETLFHKNSCSTFWCSSVFSPKSIRLINY